MPIIKKEDLRRKLKRQGSVIIKTLRTESCDWTTDCGAIVKPRLAAVMTGQLDLFGSTVPPEPAELKPNEDGLFPGFSQTWSLA